MDKAYPHFQRRNVECLNGLWDFSFHPGARMDDLPGFGIDWQERLPVPGAFDACPAHLGKRGTGVYRRTLTIKPGSGALLEFGAVSFACRVWVDGELLAEHFCGYSPFEVVLPPSDRARRELVVMAENRFDFDRIPLHEHFFDFYQYGGIIRPVYLHHLPGPHIRQAHVEAADYCGGRITVRGRLSDAGTVSATLLEADGPQASAESSADGSFSLEMTVPNPETWSPSHPRLYRLHLQFGEDDMIVRFGLREIRAEGPHLLLNGEPLRLFGYNRHEYFPNFGSSTPFAQMVHDIQLLRDLGCNFVRGSHYPQDQRFLDLCDEYGLVFWEESLGWGQKCRQLQDPLYQKHHHQCVEEMVERSYNHPCIIIWGFLNEAATDEDCFRPILNRTMAHLRARGGNRLIAYASNRIKNDRYFAEVDIIAVNIYPGWYGGEDHPEPLSLIRPFIKDFLDHLHQNGLGDRPVLISETGCEGLYGWRDELRDFHSEEYQRDYLSIVCREAVDNPRLLGVCLWHFSDAKTYSGSRALGRPRAFNNKGTFDEYRRPKLARDSVKSIFLETGARE